MSLHFLCYLTADYCPGLMALYASLSKWCPQPWQLTIVTNRQDATLGRLLAKRSPTITHEQLIDGLPPPPCQQVLPYFAATFPKLQLFEHLREHSLNCIIDADVVLCRRPPLTELSGLDLAACRDIDYAHRRHFSTSIGKPMLNSGVVWCRDRAISGRKLVAYYLRHAARYTYGDQEVLSDFIATNQLSCSWLPRRWNLTKSGIMYDYQHRRGHCSHAIFAHMIGDKPWLASQAHIASWPAVKDWLTILHRIGIRRKELEQPRSRLLHALMYRIYTLRARAPWLATPYGPLRRLLAARLK